MLLEVDWVMLAGLALIGLAFLGLTVGCSPAPEPMADGGYWLDRDRQAARSRNRY